MSRKFNNRWFRVWERKDTARQKRRVERVLKSQIRQGRGE